MNKYIQTRMNLEATLTTKVNKNIDIAENPISDTTLSPIMKVILDWLWDNSEYAISFSNSNSIKSIIKEKKLDFNDGIEWFRSILIADLLDNQLKLEKEIEDYLVPLLKQEE
jgi:hypothetical protein